MPFIEANWVWLLIAIVIGVVVIWWIWGRSTSPPESAKVPARTETAAPAAKAVSPPEAEAEAIAAMAATAPIGFVGEMPPVIFSPVIEDKAPAKKAPAKAQPKPKAAPEKAPAKAATPKPAVAKAAEPARKPATAKTPATAKSGAKPKAAPAKPDNLLQLKGVGLKLVALLDGLGVKSFAEIAAWKEADIARVDAQLGTFKGRIVRDHWIEQAGYLAKGDVKSFEAKFGKLDSEN